MKKRNEADVLAVLHERNKRRRENRRLLLQSIEERSRLKEFTDKAYARRGLKRPSSKPPETTE